MRPLIPEVYFFPDLQWVARQVFESTHFANYKWNVT